MKQKRIISMILMLLFVVTSFARNNYKVTSSSRLNVRKLPSTSAIVIGTFRSGQHIEVLSINKGWAKVKFNGRTGYVSEKYIAPLPTSEPERSESESTPTEESVMKPDSGAYNISGLNSTENDENGRSFPTKHSYWSDLNLFLTVQAGFGYSNFIWNNGSVNGTMSYSIDLVGQVYFENKVSFIPANWYSELAIGYDKRGAAKYDMNYVHAHFYPFGYRFSIKPINVIVKAGPTFGLALNDFEKEKVSDSQKCWDADFQIGVGGGFQIEWKRFALGCNVEYDFTEVSSSCGQKLNNIGILGTLSYKITNIRHK